MKRLLIVPFIMFAIAIYAQPMVKVDVSSDTVAIGETVEVTYTIENGEGKFIMPDMNELPVISGPNSSSSYMYQNGKMSSTQSYSFTLLAMEAGKLVVPGTTYQTGKDKVSIQPVEIIVLTEAGKPISPKKKSEETKSTPTREKKKF
jgi:acetaldehyde dehydrogenase (acetylating)